MAQNPKSRPPKLTKADLESKLQSEVIKFLKAQGCIVWKLQQNGTTERSRPDILFLKEGLWGGIEVKQHKNSPFRPGQREKIAKLDTWSWCKAVYHENWGEIKKELEELLK